MGKELKLRTLTSTLTFNLTSTLKIILGVMTMLTLGCHQKEHDVSPQPQLTASQDHLREVQEQTQERGSSWLFVGDSLTAGYGLKSEESYVHLLEQLLQSEHLVDQKGFTPRLINAGVSGDTSAGVLRRISWLLKDHPSKVFLCIGANDGMRGQPIDRLKSNLIKTVDRIRSSGAEAILIGMQLPPNYGEGYTQEFKRVYPEVAEELSVQLIPFLLEGVAGEQSLNQGDGIHPNTAGHQRIAKSLLEQVKSLELLSENKTALEDVK